MGSEGESPAREALLGLGSNLGSKAGNIARAIELLTGPGDIRLLRRSRDYSTVPWGKTDQDWFVNACIAVETDLAPRELLTRCLDVEHRMGRVRAERWGPRVIDIDVLDVHGIALSEPGLELPHPRLTERTFVLVPLAEIAPDLVVKGRTVRDWLADADASGVEPLG